MSMEEMRMIERILIALCGGLSIFLGYRLFVTVPIAKTGDGKFEFPSMGKITLSHVGPGIFFALFGAAILVTGLMRPIQYDVGENVMSSFEQSAHDKILADLKHLQSNVQSLSNPTLSLEIDGIITEFNGFQVQGGHHSYGLLLTPEMLKRIQDAIVQTPSPQG